MHGVTDYQVTGGQGAAAEKAALAGLGEAHGPTTGQRSGQLALPVRGWWRRAQRWQIRSPRAGQGSAGWELEVGAAHRALRFKGRRHSRWLFTPQTQSLLLPALTRYGHTFALYLKSPAAVKNSCHSVQRWSIIAKSSLQKNPPIIIMDKMRLLFKQYFPICVWQILAV